MLDIKDNKETIFQLFTALILIIGVLTDNKFVLIGGLIPLILAVYYWYRDNIDIPIKQLREEIKSLRKDLNMRKEIEDIKINLIKLENEFKRKYKFNEK